MNPLAKLTGWARAHKGAAVGVGVAAAGGAALIARRRGHVSAGSPAASGTITAAGAGGATYDSTASDVYNAIQPQLQGLQSQISALGDTPSTLEARLDRLAARSRTQRRQIARLRARDRRQDRQIAQLRKPARPVKPARPWQSQHPTWKTTPAAARRRNLLTPAARPHRTPPGYRAAQPVAKTRPEDRRRIDGWAKRTNNPRPVRLPVPVRRPAMKGRR